MKKSLAFIGYRSSKSDLLVLSWFVLLCGIGCAVFGFILGKPLRGLGQSGLMSFFFFMGVYAHQLRTQREAGREKIANESGNAKRHIL
jgi:hypothetical protein